MPYRGVIDRYGEFLPLEGKVAPVTLLEGNTPLIPLYNLPQRIHKAVRLFVKFEGLNPTGSFKDRGMTVTITRALEGGAGAVLCASTGNTSASAAAYAARAGMKAFVLIPEGKIALGKLAQAVIHGAQILQIEGNFDAAMRLVKELVNELPIVLVNSINPFRIEGQKTAAFEVIDDLGEAPDYHCLPVGNAGNITAYWKGYREYFQLGKTKKLPRMCGYQAEGAAPLVKGRPIDRPETVATAIRIGRPQSWEGAIQAQRESGGWFRAFSDEEILEAQSLLAEEEGIFCEPASATAIAGALADLKEGRIPEGSTVVCTLTGHGLKDPDTALRQCRIEPVTVPAEREVVKQAILARL